MASRGGRGGKNIRPAIKAKVDEEDG